LGLYPPDNLVEEDKRGSISREEISKAIEWITKNLKFAVAIGEIGLDFSRDNYNQELQEWVFRQFLVLSQKNNLPVIIHSRKAEARVLEILEEYDLKKVVLHCFSGKKKLIQAAKEKKYYFSVPTNIVNSEHFRMLVSMVDISRIITETDAPYLSPDKSWPNKPSNILESLKVISEIKGMTIEETSLAIFQNFQRLYL
jgi:TatD DNase family protein